MSEEKLVPKLRFSGFDDEWNEDYLNKLFDNRNERNFENLEVLSVTINDGVLKRSDLGSDRKNKDKKSMKHVLKGDLVYNPMFMWKGASGISSYEGITSADYIVLKSKNNVNPIFFSHLFQTEKSLNKFKNYSQGSLLERLRLMYPQFSDIKMAFPSYEEQEKIANLLTSVDNKIELIEKKYQTYLDFKKYLMQQIFTQKLRFNFTDDWNYMNFSEIFKSVSTKKYQIKSADILDKGDFEVIDQGQDEIAGYFNDKTKLCQELPIIIYGDHTTFVKFRDKPFIVGADGVKLLIPKFNANPKYLFYALEHFNIKPEGYKRHFSIIKKIKLPIPTLEEQNEISEIFTYIDIKLKYTKIQLQETEEFKKGLLQQMFVVQLILSLLQNKKHI